MSATAPPEALPAPESRHLAAAWWGILVLPFGLTVGYATIAVPYVLRQRGIAMTTIAAISGLAQLPHTFKFLWAPALDAGWPRKKWFFATLALTAVALGLTALIDPSPTERFGPFSLLTIYTLVLTIAQTSVATSSSAVLCLMATTLPKDVKARASGWQTAGNLIGTATGGALITWLLVHLSPCTTGALLAVLCCACAIPAFFIDEIAPERHRIGKLLGDLGRDVWRTMRARDGWTGLVICLSPVGTGGLLYLLSALVHDYSADDGVREHLVVVVNGVLGGLVQGAGALLGGYVCARMNARLAYVVFGGVTALAAVGLMLAPATPPAFTVGCLVYALANGMCYAAFYAFVLDLVGKGPGVTTKLALYVGASNLAISYVTWLDGASYDWLANAWKGSLAAGRMGMCGMDALSSFVGIAVLVGMMVWVKRRAVASP